MRVRKTLFRRPVGVVVRGRGFCRRRRHPRAPRNCFSPLGVGREHSLRSATRAIRRGRRIEGQCRGRQSPNRCPREAAAPPEAGA
eukprot:12772770-Alexandrium_andersonii.AAC.1